MKAPPHSRPSRPVLVEALLAIRAVAEKRDFVVRHTDPIVMSDEQLDEAIWQLEALIRQDAALTLAAGD